jgi:hypothetical protein
MNLKCLSRENVPKPPTGYAFVFIDEQNNNRLTIKRDDGSFTEFGNTLANTDILISLADPVSVTIHSENNSFTQTFKFSTANFEEDEFACVIDWGDGSKPVRL